MRLFLFTIVSLLTLSFSGGAFADEKDEIDTGKGLQFVKPDGWVDAGEKKGTIIALKSSDDEKSNIEFRYAKVTPKKVSAYFNSFHASLVNAGLEKKAKAETKTYGKVRGRLTEYATGGAEPMTIFVFEFHKSDAAWLIIGMFDPDQKEPYFADYETLLATIVVK